MIVFQRKPMTHFGEQIDKQHSALVACEREARQVSLLMMNHDLVFYPDSLKDTAGKLQTVKRLTKNLIKLREFIESQWDDPIKTKKLADG